MLIGIDTRLCSLSLRDRSMFNYEILSIPIELWESMVAIFRQSAGYVLLFHDLMRSIFFDQFLNYKNDLIVIIL